MDAIYPIAEHVVATNFEDLPDEVVRAARIFVLDTLGVGIAGGGGPWVEELVAVQALSGRGEDARVWGGGERLPAPAAALCNGYQIHNAEFDCVHEAAVIHPMTVLMAATMAIAERDGGVSGEDLILAAALGVDVACHLGVATTSGLRFFRPATAGALAAAAAIGRIRGFDRDTLINALSIAYAQVCGTMQAHTEGSIVLGMQIGFNARNAVVACDLAARGLDGPKNIIEGPFGYLNLIEKEHDIAAVLPELGKTWRLAEVAHKPFPSGRATHGVVDAMMELQAEHGFAAGDVEHVLARVPSLTHHLVGRPVADDMIANYARLCVRYVAARILLAGEIGVEDFEEARLHDGESLALARRFDIDIDDNPDPNALHPIEVEMSLKDGRKLARRIETVYGNPAKPMTREAHLDKFRRNWRAARRPLDPAGAEEMIRRVDALEGETDVGSLVDLMVP